MEVSKQSEHSRADLTLLYIQKEISLHHLRPEVMCQYTSISSFKDFSPEPRHVVGLHYGQQGAFMLAC